MPILSYGEFREFDWRVKHLKIDQSREKCGDRLRNRDDEICVGNHERDA